MHRGLRWTRTALPLIAALVGSLLVAPPATASPPTCDVGYAYDTLELREAKPYQVQLDCYSYHPLAREDLAFSVVDLPDHGTLGPVAWDPDIGFHVVTYDPTDGYVGTDQFTLSVSDGTESTDVVADIELTPNNPPECNEPDVLYGDMPVGEPFSWTIPCWDFDLQDMHLDMVVSEEPPHGSVDAQLVADMSSGQTLTVTYTPDPGYIGTDTFTVRLSDGDLAVYREFRVYVADAPWCFADEPRQVRAGESVTVQTLCSLPTDRSEWQMRVVDQPARGTVTVEGLRLHYTADPAASGADSFSYQATSPAGESNIVEQTVTITPNAAPTCEEVSTWTTEGEPVSIPLSCTDADGDPMTLSIDGQPEHGTLGTLSGGSVTYTPDLAWQGTDTFTYVGQDYGRSSSPTQVSVEVSPNFSCDVIYAQEGVLELREGKAHPIWVDCGGNDADYDVAVADSPEHGSAGTVSWDAELGHHVLPYSPADGYTGPDQLTFSITDDSRTDTLVVDIVVSENRAPGCTRSAEPRYAHTIVGSPYVWTVSCWDLDLQDMYLDDKLSVSGQHGTVEVEAALQMGSETALTVTYTPHAGYEGADTFTAGVTDGDLSALVEFRVVVADRTWCLATEPIEVAAGETGTIDTYCSAPDGTWPDVEVVEQPNNGTATVDGTQIDYKADPEAEGTDIFSYRATSPAGGSNVVTQVIDLPNAAPVCEDVAATTAAGTPVSIPLTCTDDDGDDHTLSLHNEPAHGSLGAVVDESVTYTPEDGWAGVDTFAYVSSDYARTSAPATVSVTVTDEEPPVIGLEIPGSQTPGRVARRGLRLLPSTDEAVAATIRLTVGGRAAQRLGLVRRADGPVRVGSIRADLPADPAQVRVALTDRAARAIRDAKRVRLTATYSAEDAFGNRSRVTRTVILRR